MGALSSKYRVLVIFVFVVLTALTYSNTLNAPFYFDDIPNIVKNRNIHLTSLGLEEIADVVSGLKGFSKRPVAHISFALNYYFHKDNVTGYHVVNIAIHILTAIFLYLFTKNTLELDIHQSFKSPNPQIPQSLNFSDVFKASAAIPNSQSIKPALIAFFAALLWLVHPIQTQSVTYIVQRMNSMSAMFYILSFLLYLKGRTIRTTWKTWLCLAGCGVAGIMAFGCKEIAVTLPVFILLYEWYFLQDLRTTWLKRFVPYLAAILILLVVVAFAYYGSNPLMAILSGYDKWDFTLTERFLTEFRVVIHYISLLVFPHPSRLNLNYDFTLSRSIIEPLTTLLSVAGIVGLLGLAIYSARRQRLASFCILWFLGNLIMESSIIPLDIAFEHRLYLPSMLFCVVVAFVVFKCFHKDRVVIGVLSIVVVLLCIWTYQRNSVWADPMAFSRDSVAKTPENPRSQNRLGLSLAKEGKFEQAVSHYEEALRINPDFTPGHNNLALALVELGRFEEAISHYQTALQNRPRYPRALYGLGVAYLRQKKPDKAFNCFSRAVRINPNYAEALNQMGRLLAQQGKVERGISHLSMALSIKPDFGNAHYNLAVALSRKGRSNEAVSHYRQALKSMPEYAEAHNNLGILLAQQGQVDEAVMHFLEAVRTKPGFTKAKDNLKRAQMILKRDE